MTLRSVGKSTVAGDLSSKLKAKVITANASPTVHKFSSRQSIEQALVAKQTTIASAAFGKLNPVIQEIESLQASQHQSIMALTVGTLNSEVALASNHMVGLSGKQTSKASALIARTTANVATLQEQLSPIKEENESPQ